MQISILHSIWIPATKHDDEMKRYAEKMKRKNKRANTRIHPVGRSGAAPSSAADTHFQQSNGPISNSMHSE